MKQKPLILMILDGFGMPNANPDLGNAIHEANTPSFDHLFENYPNSIIYTSGESVGLPDGQMGNSEIGHLNIGAGRITYSDITRIQKSLENGQFAQNTAYVNLMQKLQQSKSRLHLIGLLSDGGVHSHIDHLKEILNICQKNYPDLKVFVHAFLDGRDTPPNSGKDYVKEIMDHMESIKFGRLVSVIGRYYAMDRDKRWERIEKAYLLLTEGKGNISEDIPSTIQHFYSKDITDEFMEPISIGKEGILQDDDGVLFFNFRADRARQITRSLTQVQFDPIKRSRFPKVHFLCLTEYDEKFNLDIVFPTKKLKNLLGQVISDNGLKQLRLAETEKYAHVTFFFNGGEETAFPNEERLLIPSPKVATYDLKPEMSAYQVKDALLEAIDSDQYGFIVVNFANGDMVGHTGKLKAAIEAVETLDKCIGEIVTKVLEKDYHLLITADHGNCEQMLAENKITPFTQHTTMPVPLILVGKEWKEKKNILKDGKLADIAPTILSILNLKIPDTADGMNGESLFLE